MSNHAMTQRPFPPHLSHASRLPKPLIVLLVLSTLVLAGGSGLFFLKNGASAFSIALIVSCATLVMEVSCWRIFFAAPRPSVFGKTSPALLARLLAASLIAALLLEAGTLFGALSASPLTLADWSKKRILIFFYVSFVVLLTITEYAGARSAAQLSKSVLTSLRSKLTAIHIVGALAVFATSLAIGIAAQQFVHASWTSLAPIVFTAMAGVCVLAMFMRDSRIKAEVCFFVIALLSGLALIVPLPASNLFSWDDEVHYGSALSLSYVANAETTASDRMITELFHMEDGFSRDASFGRYTGQRDWSAGEIASYSQELDKNNSAQTTVAEHNVSSVVATFTALGYIPSALGLWLGRLLHLPFTLTFALGRLANLLSYATVMFFAIRMLPFKKTLLAVFALSPTCIFLAANYSYDAWLLSWLCLAVASTLRELSSPNVITPSRWAALLIPYFLALGPKAVYFPIVALLLLLPKEKYASCRQRKILYLACIVMVTLVVCTFALTFFGSGGSSSGDSRGGEGINGAGQLSFILSNPLRYTQILLGFLFTQYITLGNLDFALTGMAYLGDLASWYPFLSGTAITLFVGVALTDSSAGAAALSRMRNRLVPAVLSLVILALVSTALYISFTAVGQPTIAGVQARYMLPLFFPFAALTLNFRAEKRMSERNYFAVAISLSTLLLLFSIFVMFTRHIIC